MQRSISHLFAALLAVPALLVASSASAAPDAASCGRINLAAAGECHLEVSGGCKAKCEPLSFTAACEGKCNASIDVACTTQCSGSCLTDCNVDPGKFDCSGRCAIDCKGSCDGRCSAEADKASCAAYCEGTCKNDCNVKCEAVPPMAKCEAQCQGCCGGSCQAQANFDCSLDCSADLKGGCDVECEKPDGALFCDGQFVQVGNLDDCIAYLQATFGITIEYEAHGECSGNTCSGEASASVGCSAAPTGSAPLDVGAIAAMAVGLGLVASRRRRG